MSENITIEGKLTDSDVLAAINKIYIQITYVNLTENTFWDISENPTSLRRVMEFSKSYDDFIDKIVEDGRIYYRDRNAFMSFLDREHLAAEFLAGKKYLNMIYRHTTSGHNRWHMVEVIPAREYTPENQVVILFYRDVKDEHQLELNRELKLSAEERQIVGTKKVLIVEDSHLQRSILSHALHGSYDVVEATNGKEAMDYLKEHSRDISIILLDLYMPMMDGYEFMKEVQKDAILYMIPILVLTSGNDPEEEASCLNAGAVDFVTKPYNLHVLLSRMKRAIELHETKVMLNLLRTDDVTHSYTHDYFLHAAKTILLKYPNEKFDIVCHHLANLPYINEQYGSRKGEEILRYISSKYENRYFEKSVYGRIDDSTFARLVPHSAGSYKYYLRKEAEMKHAYNNPNNGLPPFEEKFGVYELVDKNLDVSIMCDRAMSAINKIRTSYNKLVNRYDEKLRRENLRNQQILESMDEAIEQRQFKVMYQPKHDIQSDTLIGAEALVRWVNPTYGFMAPAQFIPLFEENGFISYLDSYVWDEVCAAIRRWRDEGLPVVPVSVNISRKDVVFFYGKDVFRPLVEKYGLTPKDIHLEITESAYIDNPQVAIEVVNDLHDQGFVIELDDFGTGYSSLSMFSNMKLDIVKLDMSFIRQEQTPQSDKTIKYIIDMCQNMGRRVLSEGVETEEQRQRLINLGCDYIQGYYYSKPLSEENFIAYMKDYMARKSKNS